MSTQKLVRILDKKVNIEERYAAFEKFEKLTHDINYQYLDLKPKEMEIVDYIVKYGFLPDFKLDDYFDNRKEIFELEEKKEKYLKKIEELRQFLYKEKEKNIKNLEFCINYTKYKLLLKYKSYIIDEDDSFFSKIFNKTRKFPNNHYVLDLFLRQNGELKSKKGINEQIRKYQELVHSGLFNKTTKGMAKSLNMEKYLTPKSEAEYKIIKDLLFQYKVIEEKNLFDFEKEKVDKNTVFVEQIAEEYKAILKQKEKIVVENKHKATKNVTKIKQKIEKAESEINDDFKDRIEKEAQFILLFDESKGQSIFEKSVIRYGEV